METNQRSFNAAGFEDLAPRSPMVEYRIRYSNERGGGWTFKLSRVGGGIIKETASRRELARTLGNLLPLGSDAVADQNLQLVPAKAGMVKR